ncbi:MAG: methylated-DNA--[protein]-cysteine S-methyltransferase [Brevinema sp.]
MIAYFSSPTGLIRLESSNESLIRLDFVDEPIEKVDTTPSCPILIETMRQLQEYFEGKRTVFDIPLQPKGTEFRQKVWKALLTVPFGSTASYKDIAIAVGCPQGSRAVGGANHHNPISIIIPCHRIIGASGELTGYGGGIHRKSFLLDLEKKYSS